MQRQRATDERGAVLALIPGYPPEAEGWPPSALLERLGSRVDLTVATWSWPEGAAPYRQGCVHVVPLGRLKHAPWASLGELTRDWCVVHAFWAGAHALLGAALARLQGVPFELWLLGGEVTWIDALAYGTRPGSLQRFVARRALRSADRVRVGSERQLAAARGAAELRTAEILPVGVHERFVAQPPRRSDGATRLLCAASLVPVKDHMLLLEAMARLPSSFVLTLAGDGPLRAALERRTKELRLGARVEFAGEVSPRRMPDLLARSDIAVSASRHEGGSISLLEALASGRPVVSTRVGAAPELLDKGEGELAPYDAEGFAACVTRLTADLVERSEAAARRGAWIRAHWTIDAVVERIVSRVPHAGRR